MRRLCQKRTLLMVLLLLTGGAIINVAVAWGCVVWSAKQFAKLDDPLDERALKRICSDYTPYAWRKAGSDFFGLYTFGAGFDERVAIIRIALDRECVVRETSAGWPMLSMRGGVRREGDTEVNVNCSRPDLNLPGQHIRYANPAIPQMPIWPGFAINTMFYAAILWLLFAAPGFVRRRIRTRRGQCPACTYPVGQSPICTECGKPLTIRSP